MEFSCRMRRGFYKKFNFVKNFFCGKKKLERKINVSLEGPMYSLRFYDKKMFLVNFNAKTFPDFARTDLK